MRVGVKQTVINGAEDWNAQHGAPRDETMTWSADDSDADSWPQQRRWSRTTYALALYAVALTAIHFGGVGCKINALCLRDFVEPAADGSCLCGKNEYCLCTPSLAADVIIELDDGGVVFIERKDGRGLAMVGGFVKVGESAEAAAVREALEETGLEIRELRQFCVFSAPHRDPRRHTAALVYHARSSGKPKASDDAKAVRIVPLRQLVAKPPRFAFDHGEIVGAYVHARRRAGGVDEWGHGIAQTCPIVQHDTRNLF